MALTPIEQRTNNGRGRFWSIWRAIKRESEEFEESLKKRRSLIWRLSRPLSFFTFPRARARMFCNNFANSPRTHAREVLPGMLGDEVQNPVLDFAAARSCRQQTDKTIPPNFIRIDIIQSKSS